MCNRFALPASPEEIEEYFELAEPPDLVPRYNIAPGERILIVRRGDETRPSPAGSRRGTGAQDAATRRADSSLWGLRPGWARDAKKPLLNVRAETLRGKPGRSNLARGGRCLVPAGGFFEWQRLGRARQPYYFRLKESPLLAFAALAEAAPGLDGSPARHCAILTTTPNSVVAEVHDRMPVILPPDAYESWLDPTLELGQMLSLLEPFPADAMTRYPVSTVVNRAGVEDPRTVQPSQPETLF